MRGRTIFRLAMGLLLGIAVSGQAAAEPVRLAVTLPAVHSLTAKLLDGVAVPTLLSRHDGARGVAELDGNQLAALRKADLVVWTGPGLEPIIDQARALIPGLAERTLTLTTTVPVLTLSEAEKADRASGDKDLRFWLDPRLAKVAVRRLAPALARLYPDQSDRILDNEVAVLAGLTKLEKDIRAGLGTAEGVPLHVGRADLRYLEWRFNLAETGCARNGFDPMGYDLEPGAGLFDRLMDGAQAVLSACRGTRQVAERIQ